MLKHIARLVALSALLCGLAHAQPPKVDPKQKKADEPKKEAVNYKDHVLPVLRKHCQNCHNPDKAKSDFDVTTYQALMAGGASGEAVKPGNLNQSLLFRVVNHDAEPKMPPRGPKIPDADLAIIKQWIEGGAPETAVGAAKAAVRKIEIDPVAITLGRPKGPPPMPAKWAEVSLAKTDRPHPVTAMAASPWAPLVAVSGHERVLVYNTDTLKLIGTLPFPERIPHVLRFSRNGKWLLAAGGRGALAGRVVIWDVESGKRVTEIGDETDIVLAADVSPDHKWVALGGPGKLIKIYDTATGELKHKIKKHTDWVTAMEFSPDGKMLATGDRNGGAYAWEIPSGAIIFTLGNHTKAITGMNWRADSQMLATSSEDGRVIQWFAEDGFPARSINAQAGRVQRGELPGVTAVYYSRNGLIATCGRDNTARVWNANGNQASRFEDFTDVPSRVVFSYDGERILVGDFTGTVKVWTLKDQKLAGAITTNPK